MKYSKKWNKFKNRWERYSLTEQLTLLHFGFPDINRLMEEQRRKRYGY